MTYNKEVSEDSIIHDLILILENQKSVETNSDAALELSRPSIKSKERCLAQRFHRELGEQHASSTAKIAK